MKKVFPENEEKFTKYQDHMNNLRKELHTDITSDEKINIKDNKLYQYIVKFSNNIKEFYKDNIVDISVFNNSKDPIFFECECDLTELWNSDISEGTRKAIHKYVNTLYILGCMLINTFDQVDK